MRPEHGLPSVGVIATLACYRYIPHVATRLHGNQGSARTAGLVAAPAGPLPATSRLIR
jgi:hypothetical protein